tara:strand:+ start:604 stop:714 length:111 start_codon:yes stop_codon:yes gene_type:complete
MLAFSLVVTDYQEENYLNKSDTDVEFDILFIASPTN